MSPVTSGSHKYIYLSPEVSTLSAQWTRQHFLIHYTSQNDSRAAGSSAALKCVRHAHWAQHEFRALRRVRWLCSLNVSLLKHVHDGFWTVRVVMCFWRSLVCSPRPYLFGPEYSKNRTFYKICFVFKITVFYFNIFQNVIYLCDQSWIFCIITSVFSVTWSFRNHILICCSKTCIIIMSKTAVEFDELLNRKIRRTAFIWNRNVLLHYNILCLYHHFCSI